MFVTAYYDIYGNPENFIKYIYLFHDMGISGLPIVVFTDPSLVYKFHSFPSSVKVFGIPLDEFELYKLAMSYTRELPPSRNEKKDTKEFFAIMNTKVEFILKASQLFEEEQAFTWIDFGILKIVKNTEAFLNKLREIHQKSSTFDKIKIPGCWDIHRPFTVNHINWRFCGGFFVIPRKHIQYFYDYAKHVLYDFCTIAIYKLTWETNVWTIVEHCSEIKIFDWYHADHNDSIVMNLNL